MRYYSDTDRPKIFCLNPLLDAWRIRFDFRSEPQGGVSFCEHDFDHRPTISEVQAVVLGYYNTLCDEEILSGFRFEGVQVWLSSENQFNYKAAFDLAVQTSGATLPVTFKLGTDAAPVYHCFETLEDLQGFYTAALAYVNATLAKWWAIKDAINWTDYAE